MGIDHQEVELFCAFLVVDSADQHTAGIDAHHGSGRQISDRNAGFANQFFRLIILMDAGEDDAVGACAVIEGKLEKLLGLLHGFAIYDLDRTKIGLGEGVEVNEIGKQRLDLDLGEVDLFLDDGSGRRSLGGLCCLLVGVKRLHCRDGKDISVIGLLKWYSLYYPK